MNEATAHAAHYFLQLAAILAVCRACGWLLRRAGQPAVIGEMVAGVVLGPSVFGALHPAWSAALFPPESKPVLFATAQLGLTLYMFAVGLEFRADLLRDHWRKAVAVSVAGIVVPSVLGAVVAVWLMHLGGFFSGGMSAGFAALFMAAAMSITAFPMLARLILEHRLSGTPAGTIALTAGSIDDVGAWIFLAAVLGSMTGTPALLAAALGGGFLYGLVCWKGLRPLLSWWAARAGDQSMMGVLVLSLAAGAWFTDMVGLYSVFGAFVLGTAVPRGGLAEKTAERVGPLTSAMLLPVFFTYSGLNTEIGLLDSGFLWIVCGVVVAAAIAGKLLACYAAARFSGSDRPDALAVASLMNARGLMELILLNIGLAAGLISSRLFTIMVIMAIVTTLMATPGFKLAQKLRANGC
jgi:Kef-type K+ transport system membrane component KefB